MTDDRCRLIDQIIKLCRIIVFHIDTSVGTMVQVPVPSESCLPGRIMESDVSIERHPECHRRFIGILSVCKQFSTKYCILGLVSQEIGRASCRERGWRGGVAGAERTRERIEAERRGCVK